MRIYSQEELKARFNELGFIWPQNHLIAIRNKADMSDKYDDVFYWIEDGMIWDHYYGTTNPGSYYLQNFINKAMGGTAIMATNQQLIDGFIKGEHKERQCWKQFKNMKIFRDADKDLKSEEAGFPFVGKYGIHIHAMFKSTKSVRIFNWSAACQGMNDPVHWHDFITRSYIKCDQFLTYTLLSEWS